MPHSHGTVSEAERTKAINALERAHQASRRQLAPANTLVADRPYALIDRPMLVAFTGDEGSGKSLSMAAWLGEAYAEGHRVLTNSAVFFGEELDFDTWMAGRYYNCIIGLDELYELFARARSQSTIQVESVGSLITLRHQRVQLYVSAQNLDEINRAVGSRVAIEVRCYNYDGGYSIYQVRRFEPRRGWHGYQDRSKRRQGRFAGRDERLVVEGMRRWWPLYDHERRVPIGTLRQAPEDLRARRESGLAKLVLGQAVAFIEDGAEAVSTVKIQLALREHEDVDVTTHRVGRILGALDFEPRQVRRGSSKVRLWVPPQRFLDEYHPHGAVAQAGAAIGPGPESADGDEDTAG